GVLELIGVAGLVWWRGRVWWGKPLLLLAVGIYAYWLLGLAFFVVANHHLLLQDTPPLTSLGLAAAGGLTLLHPPPPGGRRPPRPGRAASPRPVPAHHLDRLHRLAGVDAGWPYLADRAAPASGERGAQ